MTALETELELFKVGSTLFLGLGLSTVLQQRLISDPGVASARGFGRWSRVDSFLAWAMLVLIGAGEVLCVRVLTAPPADQQRLVESADGPTKVLLAVTGGYVLASFFLSRLLAVAWRTDSTSGKVCTYDRVAGVTSASLLGAAVGTFVVAGVLAHRPALGTAEGTPALIALGLFAGSLTAALVWAFLSRRHSLRSATSTRGRSPMRYLETSTTRRTDLAKITTAVAEWFGLLNKGSKDASAVPGKEVSDEVTSIESNSLNVTRVGGITTLVAGAGLAALQLFGIDKATDDARIVLAAYISVGIIVAAALIAVALMIVADIRARASIAVATSAPQHDHPSVRTVNAAANPVVTVDGSDDVLLVNAAAADLRLSLPDATSCANRLLTLRRLDNNTANNVTIETPSGDQLPALLANAEMRVYSDHAHWHSLS